MFTGIIEEIGSIEQIQKGVQSAVLSIQCKKVLEGTKIGDSIAVNGVCLTVTSMHANGYTADVMAETLERSSLAGLKKGSHVNLERAMPADGRFGGHIVAGHIDGTGIAVRCLLMLSQSLNTEAMTRQVLRFLITEKSRP